jgi:TRAP-type mannitol/chloroaromatic compound transport system permease small subunit
LTQLIAYFDHFNSTLAASVRWLALAMVAATLAIVVLRYVFNMGAIPLQESVMYMHGFLFLLGIPYGIRQNTHVRVDILYANKLKPWQRHIDLGGHILFLLPVSIFIVYTSMPYALASWRVLERSPEVGGLPAIFILKSLIPLTGSLMTLQALTEVARTLLNWSAPKPSAEKL